MRWDSAALNGSRSIWSYQNVSPTRPSASTTLSASRRSRDEYETNTSRTLSGPIAAMAAGYDRGYRRPRCRRTTGTPRRASAWSQASLITPSLLSSVVTSDTVWLRPCTMFWMVSSGTRVPLTVDQVSGYSPSL